MACVGLLKPEEFLPLSSVGDWEEERGFREETGKRDRERVRILACLGALEPEELLPLELIQLRLDVRDRVGDAGDDDGVQSVDATGGHLDGLSRGGGGWRGCHLNGKGMGGVRD